MNLRDVSDQLSSTLDLHSLVLAAWANPLVAIKEAKGDKFNLDV